MYFDLPTSRPHVAWGIGHFVQLSVVNAETSSFRTGTNGDDQELFEGTMTPESSIACNLSLTFSCPCMQLVSNRVVDRLGHDQLLECSALFHQ